MVGALAELLQNLDLSVCNGCDGCGLRCTAGVPMTHQEYVQIRAYLHRMGRLDAANTECSPKGENPIADLGDGVRIALCSFRDDMRGRCTIYPVRPLICRLMGHVPWLPCPVERVPAVMRPEVVRRALDEYCVWERRPYEEWDR